MSDAHGTRVAVLIFAAAAWHLRPRDQWIGWIDEQRRRLALVANNVRFLLLPECPVPNLGSAALSRAVAQLSADWQARYTHPILGSRHRVMAEDVAEFTFVFGSSSTARRGPAHTQSPAQPRSSTPRAPRLAARPHRVKDCHPRTRRVHFLSSSLS